MDSQDQKITYNWIRDRAKGDARERMPDLPKLPDATDFSVKEDWQQHCIEEWETFISELEDLDAHDIAHECSEWDWVIYYARALELCQAVPSSVLYEAESQWCELFADGINPYTFGLYEMACQLAAIIVTDEIAQAVDTVREELLEMAENQLENL